MPIGITFDENFPKVKSEKLIQFQVPVCSMTKSTVINLKQGDNIQTIIHSYVKIYLLPYKCLLSQTRSMNPFHTLVMKIVDAKGIQTTNP